MIHDMAYEPEPEDVNVNHQKIQTEFEVKCHEKERMEKFFEEYDKRPKAN
jgi:hypothetical protein